LILEGKKRVLCLHYETQQTNKKYPIMKTESRNYRKLAIVALAFTLAFSTPTLANEGDKENPTTATELKFIGNMENQPVFELNLNDNEDEYTVIFRDEYGNVLFNDKFKGAIGLTKKFLLKSEEFGDEALKVIVKSKKNNSTEVYTINRSHSYVEETLVSKIK
jgi:hypothetical protein